jgi:dehydrogenase/reductase SDR family protein 7B
VLVLSGRNEEALNAVERECKQIFPEIVTHIITCDLSDQPSVVDLANKALELCDRRIDILINNGGVSSRSRFLDTKLDVDEKVMQINFFSGAALAKAVVPGMVDRGFGKVIWVSSVQGLCK